MASGCRLCPRGCGVDRTTGGGFCGADDTLEVASVCVHRGEEPPLNPIVNVFFAHCNLQCIYCQNWQISGKGERFKVKGERYADANQGFHLSPLTSHLIYAAASMHDIGICEGREVHHLASGRIIRADQNLRRWFSEEEIELIAQAAEDHRASATSKPRSLLGCILSEADRDIEPETIVRRTVEYGLSHYPELDREGHWQRTLDHLHEKYAEGGYIKLWMDDSPNAAPLADLRALIRDEARLRPLFDTLFDTLCDNNPPQ